MLYQFLAGKAGSAELMQVISTTKNQLGRQITHLIIAGNSTPKSEDIDKVCRGSFRAEKINKTVYERLATALDIFESYLKKFLTCCKVIIMPGILSNIYIFRT